MAGLDARREGGAELRAARNRLTGLMVGVAIFSFFVNLLMLTGPLYMLNVYDRVLGSRSVETLVALTVLVGFLFGMMGLLDLVRGRVMNRAAARFQSALDERVFSAAVRGARDPEAHKAAQTGSRDLEAIQRLISSPALMAVFDLPFAPLFFLAIFVFHVWLGILAIVGAMILIFLAILNQMRSRGPVLEYNRSVVEAEQMASQIRSESELVRSLGMQEAVFNRWKTARDGALGGQIRSTDTTGSITAVIKSFRLFLQSAMLGLGAYLVLQNEMTAGAMIAGSILLGRALAPIEMLVNQSALFQRAREGWRNLSLLLGLIKPEPARTELPRPKAKLNVEQLTVMVPPERQPILRVLSFQVLPGQAVGVIGTSGSGKSTLAKLLSGRLELMTGQMSRASKLRIGYFAQHQVDELHVDETPVDHLRRHFPDETPARLRARLAGFGLLAAQAETEVGRLSGGQKARLALLLATLDAPHLLILDEPTNHLDIESREALVEALTAYSGAVILVSHDMHLLSLVADRLWLVKDGRVAPYEDDLEAYRRLLLTADKPARAEKPKAEKPKPSRDAVKALRQDVRRCEERVEKLNEMRDRLAAKLANPALYEGEKIGEMAVWQKKYAEVMDGLDRAEALWMSALEKLEAAEA